MVEGSTARPAPADAELARIIEALRADPDELERILAIGAERAQAIASVTLADVRERMGVGAPHRRR